MNKLYDLERDPNSLQRLLLVFGLVSMVLILSLSGIGIYRASSKAMLRDAEDDGVRITTVMVSQQYKYLFSEGEKNIALNSQELTVFDRQTKDFLHPFAIVKIKVFDLDRVIIYSTDTNIIGMRVEDNIRLNRALSGEIDSHLETKNQVFDLLRRNLLTPAIDEIRLSTFHHVISRWVLAHQIAGSIEAVRGKRTGIVLCRIEVASQRIGAASAKLAHFTELDQLVIFTQQHHFVVFAHGSADGL